MKRLIYWAVLLLTAFSCSQTSSGDSGDPSQTDPDPQPAVYPKAMVVSARVDGNRVPASGSVRSADARRLHLVRKAEIAGFSATDINTMHPVSPNAFLTNSMH